MEDVSPLVLNAIRVARTFFGNTTLSSAIGALILIPYIRKNWSKIDERETIVNIVAIFLSALPICPGIAVMLLCFDKETCDLIKIEQKVFFIGGLVMVLIGIQSLRKNWKQ